MKKNKGFTLIELLAIIVILAIIAVIVTPIILGIIEDSKLSAATDSAYGYKEAIGKYYASQLSQNSDFMLNGEYTIGTDGSISDSENNYPILISGTAPNSGYLTIEKGTVTSGCIQINEYAVRIENKKVTNTEKGICEMPEVVVEEFPTVADSNPGIICGTGETEDYDNSTTCYIYSVEDLVELSSMVNSGKNFSGKTVMLMNGLDIQEDKSYADVDSNTFGDINGDSTTSTTLKEELITGKGFKTIGNNSNKFSGTFEGNTHTIKNLYINRDNTDYIGLFGYNEGTIKGLKMTSSDITGYRYVGGIVGSNKGNLTSTIFDGDVTGYYTTGLAAGENTSTGTVESITSGAVETTTSPYESSVGGIVGSSSGNVTGLFKSGSVTAANTSKVSRTVGRGSSTRTGALDTITVNESTVTSTTISSNHGHDIPANYINNIAIADNILDTYLGGDNNDDGYYYDYDNAGKFTIYKLSERPLNITMSGSGTEQSPYIINNYNDLKQVGYILGETETTLFYKLNADIDLTNKNTIMLGRYLDSNTFTGVLDGNGHTINNVNLLGYEYAGLFGYNKGTIKGLKITNGTVKGYRYAGLISGQNDGSITSTIINGEVTAEYTVGLAVGINIGTLETITTGNVNSTSTIYESSVGGIVGTNGSSATAKGIFISGSVTSGNSSSVGRTIGKIAGTKSTGALDSITVNGNTSSSASLTSSDGKDYTTAQLQTLTPYQEVGLNTSSTSGEYRYALDTNNNPTIVKNTSN